MPLLEINQDDTRIEGDHPFGRHQQWVDIDFFDPGLFDNESAKIDQQLFQSGHVDRLARTLAMPRVDLRLQRVARREQRPILGREARKDVRRAGPECVGRDPRARQRLILDEPHQRYRDMQSGFFDPVGHVPSSIFDRGVIGGQRIRY